MPFPENILHEAFARAGGKCECTLQHEGQKAPHHGGRCPRGFARYGPYWEPHHVKAEDRGGPDTIDNCQVLCFECHHLVHAPVSVRA